MRVQQLYAADAQLHRALGLRRWRRAAWPASGWAGERGRTAAELGRMAASFLAQADGPRIAMIETERLGHAQRAGRAPGRAAARARCA